MKKLSGIWFLVGIIILVWGISPVRWALSQENYVLGPEDEVEIRVWDHDDLTRKVRVGLDGHISFPFVGDVPAKGRTVSQLQKDLEGRLAKGYIIDPRVSVSITEFKSRKIFVMGNVNKPGAYPLTRPITVVEAISLAGGLPSEAFGKSASGSLALIVRAQPGRVLQGPTLPEPHGQGKAVSVSLPAAMAGDPNNNLELHNGDTLYIPQLVYYVAGQVKNPGRYSYDKDMTVHMAVTTAGGFTDKAAPKRTHIIRSESGGSQKIKTKLDDHFRPGDTIMVPESWF